MKAKALKHQPGEQIGPFTLERALGRGAAAEVWLATEVDNDAANALYRSLEPDDVAEVVGYTYEADASSG